MASRKKISELEASLSPEQIARLKEIVAEDRRLAEQSRGQRTSADSIRDNEERPTTVRLGAADRMYLTIFAADEGKTFSQLVREIVQEGLAKRLAAREQGREAAAAPKVQVLGPSELEEIARTLGSIMTRLSPCLKVSQAQVDASQAASIGYTEPGAPRRAAKPASRVKAPPK